MLKLLTANRNEMLNIFANRCTQMMVNEGWRRRLSSAPKGIFKYVSLTLCAFIACGRHSSNTQSTNYIILSEKIKRGHDSNNGPTFISVATKAKITNIYITSIKG